MGHQPPREDQERAQALAAQLLVGLNASKEAIGIDPLALTGGARCCMAAAAEHHHSMKIPPGLTAGQHRGGALAYIGTFKPAPQTFRN